MRRMIERVREFGLTFWSTIICELFERNAWYGLFSLIALYLTMSKDQGALGLSHDQKGNILAIVPFFLYIFPVFAATIGDRIGYKKVLLTSLAVLSIGYFTCTFADGYTSFFLYFMIVAIGAGMFKPMVTATVSLATRGQTDEPTEEDKKRISLGFGIFYMVVNIGGFLGPMIAGLVRPRFENGVLMGGSWDNVFIISSIYMAVMFFWIAFTYVEPEHERGEPLGRKLRTMFSDLRDMRLTSLLVILIGFWGTFLIYFYIMPSWITEWVDTSALAQVSFLKPWVSDGQLKAEMIVNLNGLAIIFLSVIVSSIVSRFNILKVIQYGIFCISLAIAMFCFASQHSVGNMTFWVLIPMIVFFTLGELMSSPRANELMGRIAPSDKVGTYQGYMFLSVAVGFFLAGKLSALYGTYADKAEMYRKVLAEQFDGNPEILKIMGLEKLTPMLADYGVDLSQLNQQLWDTYHPYMVWLIPAIIGMCTFLLLYVYRFFVPSIEKG